MQNSKKALEIHPAALVLPKVDKDTFRVLVGDVRRNGVLMAVELHDGRILESRHRARAAAEVGVEFDAVEVELGGLTLEGYVWALNCARRHLTTSQRAAVAAELLPVLEAEAKKRQGARTDRDYCGNVATMSTGERSREKAAKLTGASPRAVQDAKRIKQNAPDQFEQIKQGTTTIAEAKRKTQRTTAAQQFDCNRDADKRCDLVHERIKQWPPDLQMVAAQVRMQEAHEQWIELAPFGESEELHQVACLRISGLLDR